MKFSNFEIGEVVVSATKEEDISSVRSLQVCAGHEAGCEAAIETAMLKLYALLLLHLFRIAIPFHLD